MYQTVGSFGNKHPKRNRTLSEESHPSKRDTVICNAAGLLKKKGRKRSTVAIVPILADWNPRVIVFNIGWSFSPIFLFRRKFYLCENQKCCQLGIITQLKRYMPSSGMNVEQWHSTQEVVVPSHMQLHHAMSLYQHRVDERWPWFENWTGSIKMDTVNGKNMLQFKNNVRELALWDTRYQRILPREEEPEQAE